MSAEPSKAGKVAQLAAITGLDMNRAGEALEAAGNDLQRAVNATFDASAAASASQEAGAAGARAPVSPGTRAADAAEARARAGAGAGAGERCGRCNKVLAQMGRFCIECGLPKPGEAPACVKASDQYPCRVTLDQGAQFCTQCGAKQQKETSDFVHVDRPGAASSPARAPPSAPRPGAASGAPSRSGPEPSGGGPVASAASGGGPVPSRSGPVPSRGGSEAASWLETIQEQSGRVLEILRECESSQMPFEDPLFLKGPAVAGVEGAQHIARWCRPGQRQHPHVALAQLLLTGQLQLLFSG
ncbi:hypothetical protein T484DRAFT_1798361 [Baffinella frigidus]|nr:hypothetical protein T484DRAFT_1798361 [Cryptophyta sp. CCMP2293]